jgi:molybdenum cofactor cytidylyltransferase
MSLPPLSGLILAAGRSSRMGRFKALLPLGSVTLIERAVGLFREAGLTDILGVVGHRGAELEAVLQSAGARTVVNPNFDAGMFSSVQAGVRRIDPASAGFFVLPVDIPLVRPWTLRHLAAHFASRPHRILVPTFAGRPGHPPLIPAALSPEIDAFQASGGLRAFLAARPERCQEVAVPDRHVLFDVDRPEDYAALRERWRTHHVPTAAECEAIMTVIHPTPRAVCRHGREVARVADALARALGNAGEALDTALLHAAALLHDLAKGTPAHARTGAAWLRDMGFAEVAALVAAHGDLEPAAEGSLSPAEILFLADKCVREERRVDPETRFDAALERFGGDPQVERQIQRRRLAARTIRRRLEGCVGRPLAVILREGTRPSGSTP